MSKFMLIFVSLSLIYISKKKGGETVKKNPFYTLPFIQKKLTRLSKEYGYCQAALLSFHRPSEQVGYRDW
jgi:hypothetical protein